MSLRSLEIFYSFSAGTEFRRQKFHVCGRHIQVAWIDPRDIKSIHIFYNTTNYVENVEIRKKG